MKYGMLAAIAPYESTQFTRALKELAFLEKIHPTLFRQRSASVDDLKL
jgi:hypothetical protein